MSTAVGVGAEAAATGASAFGSDSLAAGINSFAAGTNAFAAGASDIAIGNNARASGLNSVAIGTNAFASDANSLALGAGSLTGGRANTVSVGSPGFERQITNVQDGTQPTDAVNVRQLRGGVQEVKTFATQGLQQLNRDLRRSIKLARQSGNQGTAAAVAMLHQ